MNTRNTYRAGVARANKVIGMRAPIGMAQIHTRKFAEISQDVVKKTTNNLKNIVDVGNTVAAVETIACATLPARSCRHPLTDLQENAHLARCEETIKSRFDAIIPTLKKISLLQHDPQFAPQAQKLAESELGARLDDTLLQRAWIDGLDMQALYASCTFAALKNSVNQFSKNLLSQAEEKDDTKSFFLDCDFHCVDITACSDGRLKGLSKYILRLPLSAMTIRNDYAGALFNVEENIRHWESVELSRFRSGRVDGINKDTRYLKIVVYHRSSSDPSHQGCAAHGSNDHISVESGLSRLQEFREAIENSFCCGASIDVLLIGVDTDTDAIRVHIPDSNGDLSAHRYVDNSKIYKDTLGLTSDSARLAVHDALDKGVKSEGWGVGAGFPHEGMRKLVVNLLINNLSQIEYVGDLYEGRYPDIGHAERYISVGDGFKEIQLRNIAYYAHLNTVEEGAADLDIGIKIFTGLNLSNGLPIPVAIHYRYNSKVPGSRQRMIEKCHRVKSAILNRYTDLAENKNIICQMSLQDFPLGSELEVIESSV